MHMHTCTCAQATKLCLFVKYAHVKHAHAHAHMHTCAQATKLCLFVKNAHVKHAHAHAHMHTCTCAQATKLCLFVKNAGVAATELGIAASIGEVLSSGRPALHPLKHLTPPYVQVLSSGKNGGLTPPLNTSVCVGALLGPRGPCASTYIYARPCCMGTHVHATCT